MTQDTTTKGTITQVLPNTLFKVKLEDGREIIAHLAGKLRLHHIRIIAGDQVSLVLSPEGDKGRITYRH